MSVSDHRSSCGLRALGRVNEELVHVANRKHCLYSPCKRDAALRYIDPNGASGTMLNTSDRDIALPEADKTCPCLVQDLELWFGYEILRTCVSVQSRLTDHQASDVKSIQGCALLSSADASVLHSQHRPAVDIVRLIGEEHYTDLTFFDMQMTCAYAK